MPPRSHRRTTSYGHYSRSGADRIELAPEPGSFEASSGNGLATTRDMSSAPLSTRSQLQQLASEMIVRPDDLSLPSKQVAIGSTCEGMFGKFPAITARRCTREPLRGLLHVQATQSPRVRHQLLSAGHPLRTATGSDPERRSGSRQAHAHVKAWWDRCRTAYTSPSLKVFRADSRHTEATRPNTASVSPRVLRRPQCMKGCCSRAHKRCSVLEWNRVG